MRYFGENTIYKCIAVGGIIQCLLQSPELRLSPPHSRFSRLPPKPSEFIRTAQSTTSATKSGAPVLWKTAAPLSRDVAGAGVGFTGWDLRLSMKDMCSA